MGEVCRLEVTDAQRALARYREEEHAFRIVLRIAAEWRRDDLVMRVFSLYRSRMTHLRRILGSVLGDVGRPSTRDELLGRERRPR